MAKIYSSGNTLFIGSDVVSIDSGVVATAVTDTGYTDHVKVANTEGLIYVIAPYDEIFEEDGTTNWGTDVTTTVNNLNTLFGDNNPNNYADKDKLEQVTARLVTAEGDITTLDGRVDTTESDITDIKRAVQVNLATGRGIFADDGKGNLKSYLKVADSQAVIQGGVLTRINISEASPGSHSFTVAAGPSGSETEYEALELYGKTNTGTAVLELKNGTALGFVNGSYATTFRTDTLTAARTIALPDASGTVALTSDIPSFVGYVDTTGTPANNQVAVFTDQDTIEGSTALIVDGANVGIGTTAPSEKLHVDGNIFATDRIYASSAGVLGGSRNFVLGNGTSTNKSQYGDSVILGLDGTWDKLRGRAIAIGHNLSIVDDQDGSSWDTIYIGHNQSHKQARGSIYLGNGVGNDTIVGASNLVIGNYSGQVGGSNQLIIGHNTASNPAGSGGGVLIGHGMLPNATSIDSSVAISPIYGLTSTTTMQRSVAIGTPLAANVSSVTESVLLGYGPGKDANNLNHCVLIGSQHPGTETGSDTIAIGVSAGNGNYTQRVSIGTHSRSGSYGVAVGQSAGRYSEGASNVLIGLSAGQGSSGASTFINTVAVGFQALTALTTGVQNTALGYQAGLSLTNGGYNTLMGYTAGDSLTVGSANTFIGSQAGANTTTGGNNVAIGNNALFQANNDSSFSVAIGNQAGRRNNQTNAITIGANAGFNGAENSVLIGFEAGEGDATSTFSNTTAIGYQALTSLTTGAGNTAVGYQAGAALTTNSSVTAVGYQAAYQLATGNIAVAVGYHALENLTTVGGDYGALAIGVRANENKTSLANSTSIGNRSNAGSEAVAVGGASNASGAGSTAVGQSARAGAYSTVIGHGAGDHFANVARSVLIGRDAGGTNVNSDSVMIGHQAGSQETGTHKLYIENSNSSSPLIYGEFDNDILRVNGTLQVGDPTGTGFKLPTTDGTADQVLSTDGSGNVTWVDTTLEGLPNVVSALTNNEILTYNSTLGYWVGGNSVTLNSVNTNNLTVNSSATFSSAISAPSFLLTSDGESEISVGVLSDDLALKSAGNVRVLLDKDNNETGQKFLVEDPSSTERFSIDDTGVATFNNAYSLPNADGTSGQVLTTNGSGTASWADAGGGGKSSSASGYLEIKSDSMTQLFVGPTNGIFAADYTTGNNDNQSYSHNGTAPTAGSSTISKYPYNVRSGLLDVHHDISTISFNARLRDVSQNAASCEYWVCIWHLSGGAAETFTSQTWTAAAVGTGTFGASSVNTLLSKVVATASGLSISAGDSLWITFGWVDQPAGTPDIPVNWSINMNE